MPDDHPSPPEPHPEAHLTIDDLTAGAGVTVRTVRYYIGEGLLPPPSGAGPATRYTQEHLDRLLLIGALKARYLPLREIRRRLRDLDAGEVHSAVATIPAASAEAAGPRENDPADSEFLAIESSTPPEGERQGRDRIGDVPSSASAYIDAVLREEPAADHQPARRRPPRRGLNEARIRFPGAPMPTDPAGPPTSRVPDMFPLPDDPAERRWRRIAVSPDAELTIEEDLYYRRREQIEALVAHIRRVLSS